MDLIKIKNLCFSKDTLKKMKKEDTDQEKIFTKCMSDEGFVYLILKTYNSIIR